ncbi:SurA N-terminal domain-containing protein [Myxococcaceae bacterium GXIMD 01537]
MEGLNTRKVVSLLFIIAIAVVFTLQWGPGSTGFGRANPVSQNAVATVNGKEIPLRVFAQEWANQMDFFRSRGTPITESVARQVGLPQQVVDRLVDRELLAQAAERSKVMPSDEEIRDLIHKSPSFQVDGKFDFQRYQQVLRDYYRKTAPEFEDDLRRQMAASKLLEAVTAGAVVSDDEVRARFDKQGNQVKLVFARFLPTMFAGQVAAPSADQLAEFKKAHEKEISDYYEANRFVYQTPERIKARQIVVNVPANATAEQKAAAKTKAEELRKQVEGGQDFAAVAKASSEAPDAKLTGGELGFVDRKSGRLPDAVADQAFALQAGAMTQPVEAGNAIYVVKVDEKQPAQDKKLDEVSNDIATTLYKQVKAKELAQAEAQKALAAAQGGKTLQQLFPAEKGQPALLRFETETRPEAVETDTFSASGDSVPHLGPAPQLAEAAFAAQGPQVLGQVFPAGEGFAVAQVLERKKPDDAEFAKQKDELRKQARQAKQIEVQDSYVKALRKTGDVKTNPEAIDQVLGAG